MAARELANAYPSSPTRSTSPPLRGERAAAGRRRPRGRAVDDDYLHALETRLPPTGGPAWVDRLVMLWPALVTIREVILFPTLRPGRRGAVPPALVGARGPRSSPREGSPRGRADAADEPDPAAEPHERLICAPTRGPGRRLVLAVTRDRWRARRRPGRYPAASTSFGRAVRPAPAARYVRHPGHRHRLDRVRVPALPGPAPRADDRDGGWRWCSWPPRRHTRQGPDPVAVLLVRVFRRARLDARRLPGAQRPALAVDVLDSSRYLAVVLLYGFVSLILERDDQVPASASPAVSTRSSAAWIGSTWALHVRATLAQRVLPYLAARARGSPGRSSPILLYRPLARPGCARPRGRGAAGQGP